jgi:hypothetical protein
MLVNCLYKPHFPLGHLSNILLQHLGHMGTFSYVGSPHPCLVHWPALGYCFSRGLTKPACILIFCARLLSHMCTFPNSIRMVPEEGLVGPSSMNDLAWQLGPSWVFLQVITLMENFFFQCWGSNPGPCTCQASTLPLSYIPKLNLKVVSMPLIRLHLRTGTDLIPLDLPYYGASTQVFPFSP